MKMRLPDDLTHKLIDLTENGMGRHKVTLILKDGTTIADVDVYNATIASLPDGLKVNPADWVDIVLDKKS